MCKAQLCVKHAKFFTSVCPFWSSNHQCMRNHKARVFITRYCSNSQNFLGGGEVGGFRGEASPLHPPVDETLTCCDLHTLVWTQV